MKQILRAAFFGFLIWLIPLAISFAIFPIYQSDKAFFDSIMTVSLVSSTAFFLMLTRRSSRLSMRDAFLLGLLWMTINLALDIVVFILTPFLQMDPAEYWKDIGFNYLILPVMTCLMAVETRGRQNAPEAM